MADFLVDTDVFVDHLRGVKELDPKSHRVHYSVVTGAELFSGNTATEMVSVLLAPFREIDVGTGDRRGRGKAPAGIGDPAPGRLDRCHGRGTRAESVHAQSLGL